MVGGGQELSGFCGRPTGGRSPRFYCLFAKQCLSSIERTVQTQLRELQDISLPPAAFSVHRGLALADVGACDNKIQLKFRTKDFEGEYFHYTGDLFFIYKSGHLMKLTCQKRENVGSRG